MQKKTLQSKIYEVFPYKPTAEQQQLINELCDFVTDSRADQLFMIKGYAGTGKSSIIGALVKSLSVVGKKPVLLAPTGRAAKVISAYSRRKAATIHRHIYQVKTTKEGAVYFELSVNKAKNTIFIVDEASMISDQSSDKNIFSNGSLLDDLLTYIHSGPDCKLILVGDTAQLPPVHLTISPALDLHYLQNHYDKQVQSMELREVVRQQKESGILKNATLLRQVQEEVPLSVPRFQLQGFPDVFRLIEGYEIQDALNDAYDRNGVEETAVIVHSNKRANQYNQQIRARIRWQEQELSVGDYLMVVRNNYFWLSERRSRAGFIANGDTVEVQEIRKITERYGFRFAEVRVRLVDYPDEEPLDTVLLLDTLTVEGPALSYEEGNRLYQEVLKDYADISNRYLRFRKVKENEYLNALQVKFAYAITCHKSQGGQWKEVFIEQPYLPNDTVDKDYLRWLYTAFTRATERVHLIGF